MNHRHSGQPGFPPRFFPTHARLDRGYVRRRASAVGAVRFLVPNVLFEPSLVFKAGKPDDYPDGR